MIVGKFITTISTKDTTLKLISTIHTYTNLYMFFICFLFKCFLTCRTLSNRHWTW